MEELSSKVTVPQNPPANKDGGKFLAARFSWKRVGKVVFWIVGIGVIVGGGYFFVTARPVKILWASWVLDRRENFLPCQKLPFYADIQNTFSKNAGVVAEVKGVPGVINFYPEQIRCDSSFGNFYFKKGQAVLVYKDRAAAAAAEKILGSSFFGVPYRGFAQ